MHTEAHTHTDVLKDTSDFISNQKVITNINVCVYTPLLAVLWPTQLIYKQILIKCIDIHAFNYFNDSEF